MFKVIRGDHDSDEWSIVSKSTGEEVARIETFRGLYKRTKQLKVKGKTICDIKNQDEAIVRLIEFFTENERKIEELREIEMLLNRNLEIVEGEHTYKLIQTEIKNIQAEINKLKEYSL